MEDFGGKDAISLQSRDTSDAPRLPTVKLLTRAVESENALEYFTVDTLLPA